MSDQLYKYEFQPQVVNYLLAAVNAQQTRGVEAAQNLLHVVELLKSPMNREDLEKDQMEALKAKYEPTEKAVPKGK